MALIETKPKLNKIIIIIKYKFPPEPKSLKYRIRDMLRKENKEK